MRRATVVAVLAVIGAAAWPGPLRLVSSQTPGQTSRDATAGPPQGTSAIGGTLVAADTGRPVRYARVTVTGVDTRIGRTTSTDAQGLFTVPGLNAGLYTLTASKGGMLDVIFGQKRPGSGRPGTPIQLNANQKLNNVTLAEATSGYSIYNFINGSVTQSVELRNSGHGGEPPLAPADFERLLYDGELTDVVPG